MQRVGIICDFEEEEWPSMDLVGDMLVNTFSTRHQSEVAAHRLRPVFRRICTFAHSLRKSKAANNADRLLNRFAVYPLWLRSEVDRFDVFHIVDHSYAQLAWHTVAGRTVVTCHDLDAFACLIDAARNPRPAWFCAMARRTLSGMQRAGHVVCVSNTVREALLAHNLIAPEKVSVIHNGVHPSCSPEPRFEADRRAAKLLPFASDTPLLLNVGSTVARKRIEFLLRAFASVREGRPEAKLVRVGGALTGSQARLAHELRIEGDIIELPYLDRDTLAAVYRRSTMLVATSQAEGFGLPVTEAMACGCPVVLNDIPVFREVAGNDAAFVSGQEAARWSELILRLLRERQTQPERWETRRVMGLARANQFSWNTATTRLIEIYKTLLTN
jgi:glycosyltransferase involved in cell wall biosynthesis